MHHDSWFRSNNDPVIILTRIQCKISAGDKNTKLSPDLALKKQGEK